MKLPILARLKRHIVLPLLLIAIAVIVIVLLQARDPHKLANYSVKHWYGNPAVLEDVVINGAVVDANHKSSFSWREDVVTIDTEIYPYAQEEWRYHYSNGFYKRIGEYFYSNITQNLAPDFYITRQQFQRNRAAGLETAFAYIPIKRLYNVGSDIQEHTNEITYGLAEVDGELFFTAPTTRRYTGMNGIYKLSFSDKQVYVTPNERKGAEQLVTISLEQNEQSSSSYIEVLGLEAIGSKLALIMIKDDVLFIEGYSTTGEWLGEATIAPFYLIGEDEPTVFFESYEAYSNSQDETLSLSFLDRNQRNRMVVSIDFSDGVELADLTQFTVNQPPVFEDRDYAHGARSIIYKQGRLYYGSVFRTINEDGRGTADIAPASLLLQVFEQGELVYKGELMTDINEDLHRLRRPNVYSMSYSISDYRRFVDVSIN